ncbi:MAG: C10 family peptidase [Prevotella sp.]|nr:C10 family peptidase [Prevotella sp.]
MKKRIHLLIALLAVGLAAVAGPVTQQEARQKAQSFAAGKGHTLGSTIRRAPQQNGQPAETAAYYVFDWADQSGFVIVSGDDRTEEILGYVEGWPFDADQLPENMAAWLQGYADQIASLGSRTAAAVPQNVPATANSHAAIQPMVKTKWGQDAPYNQLCPTVSNTLCPTGCIATSMAQIMKFHQWPQAATATIPSYRAGGIGQMEELPSVVFDWSLMSNTYHGAESDESRTAVATLMKYCGYATRMGYNPSSSGSYSQYVVVALRNYFGYDTATHCISRSSYSATVWDDLIYAEIAARRPVLYAGQSTGGGHAFVCDGYDGNGFYHINWGWDGYCDGYFKLAILNPYGSGTGGSTTDDGFSMGQEAIIGIQPPVEGSQPVAQLMVYDGIKRYGSSYYATFMNMSGISARFDYGFRQTCTTDETRADVYHTNSGQINNFSYDTYSLSLGSLTLANGTYRFYPVSKLSSSSEWIAEGCGNSYIEVTVNGSDRQYSIHPIAILSLEDVEFTGNLFAGASQEVKVSVKNEGDEENAILHLTVTKQGETDALIQNETEIVAEANTTAEAFLYFTPAEEGTYEVTIAIDGTDTPLITKTVVIKPAPTGRASLALVDYTVDATETTATLKVNIKNNNDYGYYSPILAYLFDSDNRSIGNTELKNVSLEGGETQQFDFVFEGLEKGSNYRVRLYIYRFFGGTSTTALGSSMNIVTDGSVETAIEPVANGEAQPFDVYSLTGQRVRRATTSLSGLPAGIYVVNGRKVVVK